MPKCIVTATVAGVSLTIAQLCIFFVLVLTSFDIVFVSVRAVYTCLSLHPVFILGQKSARECRNLRAAIIIGSKHIEPATITANALIGKIVIFKFKRIENFLLTVLSTPLITYYCPPNIGF